MPFAPGETVDLRFIGDPATAVFHFLGQQYTVANGGLEERRKSALHPIIRLPLTPGKYPYRFETDGETTETGDLRVTNQQRPRPRPRRDRDERQQPAPPQGGIRARRFGER